MQRALERELAGLAAAIVIGGIITGLLAGLFGVGGAVLAVPVLTNLFGTSQLVAQGLSLALAGAPVGAAEPGASEWAASATSAMRLVTAGGLGAGAN